MDPHTKLMFTFFRSRYALGTVFMVRPPFPVLTS